LMSRLRAAKLLWLRISLLSLCMWSVIPKVVLVIPASLFWRTSL
ncbi:glycosyl hydrolases family 2, sugar binding domain protein, partial [Vibrio parahaemolyticus AQ3810]